MKGELARSAHAAGRSTLRLLDRIYRPSSGSRTKGSTSSTMDREFVFIYGIIRILLQYKSLKRKYKLFYEPFLIDKRSQKWHFPSCDTSEYKVRLLVATENYIEPAKVRPRLEPAKVRPRLFCCDPRPRRGRTFSATRDPCDPATLPTLGARATEHWQCLGRA